MAENGSSGLPRRLKWVLGLSLAFNLVFVGMIAGAVLRHDGPGARFACAPGADSYAAPYVIALPREDRRAIFRDVRRARSAPLPDRDARRALYADVIAAVRAEPFDAPDLRAALKAQHSAGLQVQDAVQGVWVERVAQMNAQQRADYALAIEEVLRRGPRRGKDRP